jgi:hypothetical protein
MKEGKTKRKEKGELNEGRAKRKEYRKISKEE